MEIQRLCRTAASDGPLEHVGVELEERVDPEAIALGLDAVFAQLLPEQVEGLIQAVAGPVRRQATPEDPLHLVAGGLALHGEEDQERSTGRLFGEPGQLRVTPVRPEAAQRMDAQIHGGTALKIDSV